MSRDPCSFHALKRRNATVDGWAECGWPYSQGYVAGRDGRRRDRNPRRGPANHLWEIGFDAGKAALAVLQNKRKIP